MNASTAMESVTMLRDPAVVMDPYRLGAMHQTRLSFVRTMLRKMETEKWQTECVQWEIAPDGFGTAVYELRTPNGYINWWCFPRRLPMKSAMTG